MVKCRPPNNRDPQPEELSACDKYLERQIAAINPKIIITLGRFSMAKFVPGAKISQVHGQMRRVGDRFVIAMFHPAAALHQGSLKPASWPTSPGFRSSWSRPGLRSPNRGAPPRNRRNRRKRNPNSSTCFELSALRRE